MAKTKIKATYRFCRGVGWCTLCPKRLEDPEVLYTYGDTGDIEAAEKLLYENMFNDEREAQNERYRQKSNYGRIWTMDEWRTSVRHRPIENVLFVGNEKCHISSGALLNVYDYFCKEREERFGDIFVRISAFRYADSVIPHIHERYVLYWEDDKGIKHTEINEALKRAGVDIPFPENDEGKYNNRKMMFDMICREMWLDILAEGLEDNPIVELVRPDPGFKLRNSADQESEPSLDNVWWRNERKISRLNCKIKEMKEELEEICDDMDMGIVPRNDRAAFRERRLVLKNKIATCTKSLEKLEDLI